MAVRAGVVLTAVVDGWEGVIAGADVGVAGGAWVGATGLGDCVGRSETTTVPGSKAVATAGSPGIVVAVGTAEAEDDGAGEGERDGVAASGVHAANTMMKRPAIRKFRMCLPNPSPIRGLRPISWSIGYDGKMKTKTWVKLLFAVLIVVLVLALILLFL